MYAFLLAVHAHSMVHTMGLSPTVCEINGIFGRKCHFFPTCRSL